MEVFGSGEMTRGLRFVMYRMWEMDVHLWGALEGDYLERENVSTSGRGINIYWLSVRYKHEKRREA